MVESKERDTSQRLQALVANLEKRVSNAERRVLDTDAIALGIKSRLHFKENSPELTEEPEEEVAEPKKSPAPYDTLHHWQNTLYFFYGTLRDPSKLAQVLGLDTKPILPRAQISGYSGKAWGPYPAIVRGGPGDLVEGVAYEVKSRKHAEKLQRYETSRYGPEIVDISLAGEIRKGLAFVWQGNAEELDMHPFDLKIWQGRHL
ncbi:hypothetical protein MMC28_004834 [Mycoblastus sanguinarius]|nr:hypothetical protein [Mycoblastus sanguinarius]